MKKKISKILSIIYFLPSIILIISCGHIDRVDTTAVKEKMGDYQIKRITPTQVMTQVESLGENMTAALTAVAEKEMKTASKTRQEEICQLKNIKLIDSLSRSYGIKIRLLGTADVQNKSLYDKEREVMDAYVDSAEKKQILGNNIQKIGDSLFVYSAPIAAKEPICSRCFKDNLAVWSIVFRKANVIRKMDMKHLK